ncbi:MAG TPA: carboxypeptidase regulatory-like domain-containing protein [Terriglobales bacterium]|jgi:hypothetical protein|nr:carboxypeptidase regulatory-like domain-containing protein [Terriglobales bacterium]
MDRLQKLVADRLRTQAVGQHPEAEVLSAFAENALPRNEREAVAQHLSACADCREILYLAAPPLLEQQEVFAAPKARPYFALRWGTLIACIAIAAVILVSRREGRVSVDQPSWAKQEPTSTTVANKKVVAQDQVPAELDKMREQQTVLKAPAATRARGYAPPKPSIAEPNRNMAFDESGQVSAARGETLNEKLESDALKDLPLKEGRPSELVTLPPGAASGSAAAGGVVGSRDARQVAKTPEAQPSSASEAFSVTGNNRADAQHADSGWVPASAPALANATPASFGSVGGTISDPAGAAVTNAKVTAVGPRGQKTAVSDGAGKFSFDRLAAGTYLLKVDAAGFRNTLSQVSVISDRPATADFKLQVAATAETVEIEASAAPVAQPSASNGELMSQETANSLQAAQAQSTTERMKQKADSSHAMIVAKLVGLPRWSLSPQGTVQRSNNGGTTWVPIEVAKGSVFRAIASIGDQVWAAGNMGVLYHSLDNGQHWTHVVPISKGEKLQADIVQIQFADPQHLSLNTTNGQVWQSSDGGQTWARQ